MSASAESSHQLNSIDGRINDRGFFERILAERGKFDDEREKRLNERFEAQERAVEAALKAQKEATSVALVSAEKAVEKAEQAQLRVNTTQNEFRGTLKDQAADLMPRAETELLVREMRAQIGKLENFQAKLLGVAASSSVITAIIVYLLTR